MKKLNTILNISPIETIISVHVTNIMSTPRITGRQITAIISNLEGTYGADIVESIIMSCNSEFYLHYYGVLKPLSKVA